MVNYAQLPQNPAQASPASGTVITSMNVNYFNIKPQQMSDPDFALRAFPIETKKVAEALAQQFPDALNISVSPKTTSEIKDGNYTIHHQLFTVVGFPTLEQAQFYKEAIEKTVRSFDPNRPIEPTQPSWATRTNPAGLQLSALPGR